MTNERHFSFELLRAVAPWIDEILYCRDQMSLNSNIKNTTKLVGTLKITNLYHDRLTWNDCGFWTELPELIGHYLLLNLSFVTPNQDFDGSLGLYNETHSKGALKMIAENQVDYIFNNIPNDFLTEHTWNPNLYQLSTALRDDYRVAFGVKKEKLKISISDYFRVFSPLIWLLIFSSIIAISLFQTCSNRKGNLNFFLKLCGDYIGLLLNNSSNLLQKSVSRHYLLYFIPILSILIINLINIKLYSNMLAPRKHWCQDLNCFIKSKLPFYTFANQPSLTEMRKRDEFKMILERIVTDKSMGESVE